MLQSCNNPANNSPVNSNIVTVLDDIDQPTTWSGDSIYLVRKWDFYVNNTLTIQPGAIVKFHPTEGPDLTLGGSGTIVAIGTAGKPIIFTSFKDDAHGGDQNGDGAATLPEATDWGSVNTNGLNSSEFEYCEFYYGGKSTYNATLTLYGSNIVVTNCVFAHNDGSYTSQAGDVGVLDASAAGSGTIIRNNVFYGNVRPLSVSIAFSIDSSNIFHNPANPSQANICNAIFVETIEDLSDNISWLETEVAYVIDDNDFWIESGATLTLADNVVIKCKSGSAFVLDDGASAIVNRTGANIYFTSYKDDTRKGDSNGDGATTTPAAGDWIGIYDNTSTTPPHYFTWVNILYDSY
jgi:hypothetical protein